MGVESRTPTVEQPDNAAEAREDLGITIAWVRSLLRWGDVSGKPAEFAPSSHTHAAADIVSGTLPVERGGTGAATASAAREALGIVSPWSPGDAKFTHAATLEPGWIEKDGRALNRITYAALFAAIGTAYGIGDGATTFNIPDDRGRMIIGSGNAPGRSNRQRGQTGGEESVTLTTAHIPEHEHEAGTLVTDVEPDHTHTAFIEQGIGESSTTPGTADTASDNATGVTGGIITISSDGEHSHGVTGSTASAGGGQAHNNMPPFSAARSIIYTGVVA